MQWWRIKNEMRKKTTNKQQTRYPTLGFQQRIVPPGSKSVANYRVTFSKNAKFHNRGHSQTTWTGLGEGGVSKMFTFVHKEGGGGFTNVHVAFSRVIFQILWKVAKRICSNPKTNRGIHTLKITLKNILLALFKKGEKNIIGKNAKKGRGGHRMFT